VGQHKYSPLRFRPSEKNRAWLLGRHEKTGEAVNAIVNRALDALRVRDETTENSEEG
jgi:hypothetical protein